MQKKFHFCWLGENGLGEKKNREPQSKKLPTMNVLGYMKDEIMARAEGEERKFPRNENT